MAKLIHNKKEILSNLKYASSFWDISIGLMFRGKETIKKGICLEMPSSEDIKTGATITMLFCFHPLEILFVNSKHKVVDKTILKPWALAYTPKAACKYVFETTPNTFKNIKIGDNIKIEM